jgi:hypothetical protein
VEGFLERVQGFVEWLADGANWARAMGEVSYLNRCRSYHEGTYLYDASPANHITDAIPSQP